MASEWIKMRPDLHDDPKVISIATALQNNRKFKGWVRPGSRTDAVTLSRVTAVMVCVTVASLLRVWGKISRIGKRDGERDIRVTHATLQTLDTICDIDGFGESMASVGWVKEDINGLVFSNYLDENSSAEERKKQAAAERQRRKRERDKGVTEDVTGGVTNDVMSRPREEKIREEKTIDSNSTGAVEDGGETTAGMVVGFVQPELADVVAHGRRIMLSAVECEKFHAHYAGMGWCVSGNPIHDWRRMLKKWQLNASNFERKNGGKHAAPEAKAGAFDNFKLGGVK